MGESQNAVVVADAGSRMLVAAEYAKSFSSDWFNPLQSPLADKVVAAAGGRGTVMFLDTGEEHWVLRHYRRGGLVGRINHDLYLWTGAERTRSFSEFRLLQALAERGLPVPDAVAARFHRHGLVYRADIITRRIDDAQSWSALLAEASDGTPGAQWQAVGACIRRFHDAGVFHADLNAHNIMINSLGEVFVLDFDRGALRGPGGWQQANLERLQRSLRKISGQCDAPFYSDVRWRALLDGYAA
ncbi:MAG: 3-deoxy-D-manno-octulosonic acid kinase [Pseudomonadota bacterium]